MRHIHILFGLVALFVFLASPAVAQEIDGFWPGCGAPGDKILIRGAEFADDPAVSIGGTAADVLRSRDDAILCLIPDDLVAGPATLTVDGLDATESVDVLAEGTPVVYRLSASRGPEGMPVFAFGRRLRGGSVAFVDASDVTQAEIELEGGRRCIVFEVPEGLALGTYTLVFTNGDDLDTGTCSPSFEIVEAGDAALVDLTPESAPPGAKVTIGGTDLAPPGPCLVTWTDADGETLRRHGFSNGYDTVRTCVPYIAEPGATYDVAVELRNGTATDAVAYTVGERGDPEIVKLDPDAGPAGSVFAVRGKNLVAAGLEPTVALSDGSTSTEAEVLFSMPGFLGMADVVVAVVPGDLPDGAYDVTLSLDGVESNAHVYTVGALPLTVTRMMPAAHRSDREPEREPRPVAIEGTGFGSEDDAAAIQVIWDDGTDTFEAEVLFRSDRFLYVAVPANGEEPLAEGTYTVRVVLDPDGTPDSVEAGTYTVL